MRRSKKKKRSFKPGIFPKKPKLKNPKNQGNKDQPDQSRPIGSQNKYQTNRSIVTHSALLISSCLSAPLSSSLPRPLIKPMHRHPRMHIQQILRPRHRPTPINAPPTPLPGMPTRRITPLTTRTPAVGTRRTIRSHSRVLPIIMFLNPLPRIISRQHQILLILLLIRSTPIPRTKRIQTAISRCRIRIRAVARTTIAPAFQGAGLEDEESEEDEEGEGGEGEDYGCW